MEYFREEEGKYISKGVPGASGGSGAVRAVLTLLPLMVLGGIYFTSVRNDPDPAARIPFLVMGGIFLFTWYLTSVLRRRGHGSGLTVDQMKGTIRYRRPGGQRHEMPVAAVREIGIQMAGGGMYDGSGRTGGGMLFLLTEEGKRVPIAYSRKGNELRHFADELSILTSLTVNQSTGGREGS